MVIEVKDPEAGVLHMVNFNYRRVPAVALARQMIQEGRLGKIHHYHGAYFQDWIIDPSFPLVWRMDKKYAASGALAADWGFPADAHRFGGRRERRFSCRSQSVGYF